MMFIIYFVLEERRIFCFDYLLITDVIWTRDIFVIPCPHWTETGLNIRTM